jgi:hypothetical protein
MPLAQLRLVAAIAVVSGLSAAGFVFADEKFGLSTLQRDVRRTR